MKKIVKVGMGSIFLFSMLLGQNAFAEDIAHEVKQVPAVEGSGIIDEDKPIIQQTAESGITPYSVLPSKFDFNSGNVKTLMRNQGELGLCWAFSAVDVITASNKKEFGVEYTLSPNYFNYYSARNAFTDAVNPYGTRTLNDGGNSGSVLIQSTLNDNGVLEENFVTPYALSQNKPMMISAFKEKQEKKSPVFVEGMEKIHGISYNYYTKENQQQKIMQMKEKLYEYGALTFSYSTVASHNKKYFNSGTKASFVPIADVGTELVTKYGTDWVKTDHGIVIVGWDDNFSKDNFVETPEKDGAFLVKNSWGESSSSNGVGYFYMSYEDVYMLCSDNYAVDTKMEQYDNVNTYVNTTRTHYVNWSSSNNDMYLGNVYSTKDTRETLNAVSFYSEQKNIGYEVYYSANAIQSGQTIINQKDMKKIASGTVATPGMKEIPTEIVEIDKNQEYSIIIKVNYPKDVDHFHTVLQEVRDAEKGNFPDLKEGKSFVSTDDRSNVIYWRGVSNGDTFGGGFKGNLFVNAFTDNIVDVTEIEMTPTKKELLIGETAQLTAKALPEEAPDKTIVWSSTDSTIVSVDDNGKITSHQAGNAKIIATSKRGDVSAECEVTVEDKHFSVDDIVIGKNMSVLIGEEKQPEFSLRPENADSSSLKWAIKHSGIASVDKNGVVTGKHLGHTILSVSTSDDKVIKEIVVHVNSLYLGKTQAEAKEMELPFNSLQQSDTIYTDEAGWLKFKADTTAMYTVSDIVRGNFKPGQKVEMGFHNAEESRRLGLFGWDQRSASSGVSWKEAPVYYQQGEYVYIKTGIVSFQDGETQFRFSLKRDITNPQPVYTKKVTINNKKDITLLKEQTQSFTYTVDNYTTKPNKIELVSDDSNVAEVVEDGTKQFKIIAKNPGKTTIRVKETSGSNKEDSLEVTVPDMLKLGQTKEEAPEIAMAFDSKGLSTTKIYTDHSGWVKFKSDETAMYMANGVVQGNFQPGQKVEVGFSNEGDGNHRQAVFGWDQRAQTSGVSWNTSKAYYQAGEYIYVWVYTVKIEDGNAQFNFGFKRDLNNPQPVYTKNVTINNKKNLTMLIGDTQSFTYAVDGYITKPNKIELISDDPNVAEIVSDGAKQFKVVAKGPGKTTIRVKETSGSNKEDSLEVTVPDMFKLGQTKEEAPEITMAFDKNGVSTTSIYTDRPGWVKFKADEKAMYTTASGVKGKFLAGQKVEVAFMNEQYETNKQAVFGWDQRTANSGVSWTTSKAYYEVGEYIYINVYTINITDGNAQFHFSLKRDTTNPQPVYTKNVTINNKKNLEMLIGNSQTFTFTVDNYCTKPKQMEYVSDNPDVAEVVSSGNRQIKITAKGPGKTTIRVKDVSGSNKEDSLEVTVPEMLQVSQTKEEAPEITMAFDKNGISTTRIYADQAGWLKFKADETAMYMASGVVQGNFKMGQKVEVAFMNEQYGNNKQAVFGWDQRTDTSGVSWNTSKAYYQEGEYIYINLYTINIVDGNTQFYFSLKKDTTNPQPIYTKAVTITNKQNITLRAEATKSFSYVVDTYSTKQIELVSDDSTIAEVVSEGGRKFKIIAKNPGKTTIRVKDVSGSNKEDSLEVTVPEMLQVSQTKEEAPEINLTFDSNGVSTTKIHADQVGWLKFRADETAMYTASGVVQGDFKMGQKVEVAFMNEQYENNKQAVFGWDQRTATSGVSWNTSKAYYQEGEYIYINLYTINIVDGNTQFHFSLKKDTANPQPIYTKAVTITNKQNITQKADATKSFSYVVDNYCIKKMELVSDDPTIAEVVSEGGRNFKIIAKNPGKTTIRVKDVSGSNKEDSLEVTVIP